jgi:hypothetical protein
MEEVIVVFVLAVVNAVMAQVIQSEYKVPDGKFKCLN